MSKVFVQTLDADYLTAELTVGTSAVLAKVGSTNMAGRENVEMHNLGPQTVYYGPSGVTVDNGMPLFKNQWISIPCNEKFDIYLICSAANNKVRVQEKS